MSGIRIIALIAVLVALVVFTVQNLSPALPLVFLGGQTQALPLAFWLLGAIALGSITALLIAGFTRPAKPARSRRRPGGFTVPPNPFAGRAAPPSDAPSDRYGFSVKDASRDRTASSSRQTHQSRPSDAQATAYKTPKRETETASRSSWMPNLDNWGWGASSRDDNADWGDKQPEEWEDWEGYEDLNRPDVAQRVMNEDLDEFEELEEVERSRTRPPSASTSTSRSPSAQSHQDAPPSSASAKSYEVEQTPEEVYRSGSVYSYSYRKPESSGAGRVENVYDRSDHPDPSQTSSSDAASPAASADMPADYSAYDTGATQLQDDVQTNRRDRAQGYSHQDDYADNDYADNYRADRYTEQDYRDSDQDERYGDERYGDDSYGDDSYGDDSYRDRTYDAYDTYADNRYNDYDARDSHEPSYGDYEAPTEPETADPSAVYDADFRVIMPPYEPEANGYEDGYEDEDYRASAETPQSDWQSSAQPYAGYEADAYDADRGGSREAGYGADYDSEYRSDYGSDYGPDYASDYGSSYGDDRYDESQRDYAASPDYDWGNENDSPYVADRYSARPYADSYHNSDDAATDEDSSAADWEDWDSFIGRKQQNDPDQWT
jgi:uncharacterized integral membrane protein